MKHAKKAQKLLAALFLLTALTVVTALTVFADEIPTKVRAYPKQIGTFSLVLSNYGDRITNVKGTGLKIKVTHEDYSSSNESNFRITFLAKKKGKFKITFDIVDKDGNKKDSKKVTVYSYPGSPIKSITYGGKSLFNYYEKYKKSGKLVVKMNSGYKLVKIELGTYGDEQTTNTTSYSKTIRREATYKTIKNKSTITLSKKGYYYLYDYKNASYYNHTKSDDVTATTYIRITYKDKYTKQEDITTFSITRTVWK